MAEISDLSVTDASNTARFYEGQPASTLNDGGRGLEGMLGRGFKDTIDGAITTGGTTTAYTVAANRTSISAYYDKLMLTVEWDQTCGATPTINVNSIGAKSLYWPDGTQVTTGDLIADSRSIIQYDGTNFQVLTSQGPNNIAVSRLADGTDGELITWGSDGAPATVAAGTSGQVLTSNGAGAAPTFQDAANTTDTTAQDLGFQALLEIDYLSGYLGPRSYGNAAGDAFNDESGIDTTASLNETYDATNDLYSNPGTPSLIDPSGETTFRTFDINSGAAFDGNTSQNNAAQERDNTASTSGFNNWIGLLFGTNKTITQAIAYSATDVAFVNSATADVRLEYSTNTTDGSDGSWTTLQTISSTSSGGQTLTFNSFSAVSAKAVRFNISGNGSNTSGMAEARFYEAGTAPDMTLQSKAATIIAASAPTEIRVQVDIEAVDALTLTGGTPDVVLSASRDGNTTFSTITLDSTTAFSAGQRKMIKGTVVVSGQPYDTDIVVKAVTDNGKEVKIHGWTIQTNQALTIA
jgi:hypothetical protein